MNFNRTTKEICKFVKNTVYEMVILFNRKSIEYVRTLRCIKVLEKLFKLRIFPKRFMKYYCIYSTFNKFAFK